MAKTKTIKKSTKAVENKQEEFNAKILEVLADLSAKVNQGGKSDEVTESTKKVEAKTDEWTTLAESGKGKRIVLAPADKTGKYAHRGVVVSRFAKSIFVPADQFGEFVSEVEVAYQKLKDLGQIA
jgi:hypothetical protein